jgi:CheY-like chemotaxis protein
MGVRTAFCLDPTENMGRKALIVQVDSSSPSQLAENLREWQFEVTLLGAGDPVIPWVMEHHPHLILLDLFAVNATGHAICQALKLDRQSNLIPLIMVTPNTSPEDRVRGLEVGANYYLTKPFTREQLYHAISVVFAWRRELQRYGTEGEIHFQLQSAGEYLEQMNQLLASLFLFTGLSQTQINHLMLAVRELGINAIEWGHRKQVERIVHVTYRIDSEKVTIVIRDSGPGFDPGNVPHAVRPDDPTAHLELREMLGLRDGGCGILMARGLVDELEYNETGNEVRLVKYFPPVTKDNTDSSVEEE